MLGNICLPEFNFSLSGMEERKDFRLRSKAICAMEDALKLSDNLALVQPYLDSLLRTLLSAENHPDVLEDRRRVLSNLISRLPLENLEDHVSQIVTGLCRQGGAGANLVAKNLMQRLPTAAIVLKLLSNEFLQARSSKFRENALQMVIYALLTFPSTYFDVANCVERTAKAALDRKKRVRQAALDVLAVLGQISSPKIVTEVVTKVAEYRKDGLLLIAAVKARLARKQLPLVHADGDVQYALKVPTSSNVGSVIMFGSDIEWICSGSGSVSPTSTKNRSYKIQGQDSGRPFDERRITDGLNRYANGNTGTPTKKSPWSRIPVKNSSGSVSYCT
ncbi:CLUMA_CG015809, isoform A [Clunio marinus]|uniref:CLUMA_CG015809, isoform A n=1 Tax=Clunio marinus TaxID=568069 RepID=A0A1J1IUF9_9DIPT|nr:CLUMA_CG015809, isoform A [Clunio marinus]